jgi:biotin transport system permease protein
MADDMTPYAYRSGKSPLHRCPAGLKLLGLLALSAAAFSSVPGLAAAALILTAGAITAGIPPRELLRGSKPLFPLALFIILCRTLDFTPPGFKPAFSGLEGLSLPNLSRAGFWEGLAQGLCIIVSFAGGALLFSVTTMRELRDSLGSFEGFLEKRFLDLTRIFRGKKGRPPSRRPAYRLSLGISLMLGFLPRFFEIWEAANLACEARACKKGLPRLRILLPLVTEKMMETAGKTAESLDSRGLSLVISA